jgi:nucleotide-binding universal stress UspA family protein
LPALALGLSPPDRDIMQRPPRDPAESVFSRDVRFLVLLGVLIECPIFLWVYFDNYGDIEAARTKIFLLFVLVELIISMSFRSLRFSVFESPPHKWLLIAIVWELALLAVLIQFPAVRETFGIRMPAWPDVGMVLAVGALVLVAIELAKAYLRATSDIAVAGRGRLEGAGHAPWMAPASDLARGRASRAPASSRFAGEDVMRKILIPVDSSHNCQFAVRHVVQKFMNNTAMEVHLLNVQTPFSQHIARFLSRKTLQDFHRDQAEKALAPARQILDSFAVPHSVHVDMGERAKCITDAARLLRCDQIVLSTARKNSLTRLVEDSVVNRVIETTSVPVEIIAGDTVSKFERYGIPAALAAALAALLTVVD